MTDSPNLENTLKNASKNRRLKKQKAFGVLRME